MVAVLEIALRSFAAFAGTVVLLALVGSLAVQAMAGLARVFLAARRCPDCRSARQRAARS